MPQPRGWTTATTGQVLANGRAVADALDRAAERGRPTTAGEGWDEYFRPYVSELLAHAETSEYVQQRLAARTPEEHRVVMRQLAAGLARYLRHQHLDRD